MVKYVQLLFSIPRLPMQFICMYLIGPLDPSSKGHKGCFNGDMDVDWI